MKKNTKKKFRDIRNAVVMMCVMVAMMSTASYAWFQMTGSPTVTGMKMTAASSGGALLVANDSSGSAVDQGHNAIMITDAEVKKLTPVTPNATAGAFQLPVYAGNKVESLTPIAAGSETKYVAKYTYHLISDADDADGEYLDIGIICGNVGADSDQLTKTMQVDSSDSPSLNGSLVRRTPNSTETDINPAYAIRVGFVVTSGDVASDEMNKMYIWEPNYAADMTADTKRADSAAVDADIESAGLATPSIQSKDSGAIVIGGAGNVSDKLFSLAKGGSCKIDMYVWLEGSDPQCGDSIQAGELEAQVQFTALGDAATTGAVTP